MWARNRGASPLSGFLLALFVAGSSGAFTDGELALEEINAYRSEVGVKPMTYDTELAAAAQKWADHLQANESCAVVESTTAWRNRTVDEHHPGWSTRGIGELLTKFEGASPDGGSVVAKWAAEKGSYIFGGFGDDCTSISGGPDSVKSYAQLIWATTEHVGCGVANCSTGGSLVYVCMFHPAPKTHELPFCGANLPAGMDSCGNVTADFDRPAEECVRPSGGCLNDGTLCATSDGSECNDCAANQVCDTSAAPTLDNATCTCALGCSAGTGGCGMSDPCPAGYEAGEPCCSNINECATEPVPCPNYYVSTIPPLPFQGQVQVRDCKDTIGSFHCSCKAGFIEHTGLEDSELLAMGVIAWSFPDENGLQQSICLDVNECETPGTNICKDPDTECVNTFGSFECACVRGYARREGKTCEDVDECELRTHNCHPGRAACHNTNGSFTCSCNSGYVTPEQNLEIQDCSTVIVEATAGDYNTDGTYCVDVDECAARECAEDGVLYKANVTCSANASCWNTPGSYVCLCNEGLSGEDGTVCKNVDECSSAAPSTSGLSSMAWLCKGCELKSDPSLEYYFPFASSTAQCQSRCLSENNCIGIDFDPNDIYARCMIKLGSYASVDSDTTVRVERVHPVKHFSPTRNAYVRHNKAKSDVSTAMPFDRSLVVAHSSCAANADCIDLDPGYTCTCNTGYVGDHASEQCFEGSDSCPRWSSESDDGCTCKPGFEGDASSTGCLGCEVSTYSATDNATASMCTDCGSNSWSPPFSDEATDCKCNAGYYRDSDMPAATGSTPADFSKPSTNDITEQQKAAFVAEHNAYRLEVGVENVAWDDEIASVAQKWAEELKNKGCSMQHSTREWRIAEFAQAGLDAGYSGENLAWAMSSGGPPKKSGEEVSGMWASEKQDYAFGPVGDSCTQPNQNPVGHYTQMVWAATQKIGCAAVECSSQKSTLWVCMYYPGGNYVGQLPFCKDGQPPGMPSCPNVDSVDDPSGRCTNPSGSCPSNGDCCSCVSGGVTRRAGPVDEHAYLDSRVTPPQTVAADVAVMTRSTRRSSEAPAWCSRRRGTTENPCTKCPPYSYVGFGRGESIADCTCWRGDKVTNIDPADKADFACVASDACASASSCDANAVCSPNPATGRAQCTCKKDQGYERGTASIRVQDGFCYGFKYVDDFVTTLGSDADVLTGDKLLANFADVNRQVLSEVYFASIGELESQTAIDIPNEKALKAFFRGTLSIGFEGKYDFCVNASDGARLYVGETRVVNHDGAHPATQKCNSTQLAAGEHVVTIVYFANPGAEKKLWAMYKGIDTADTYKRIPSVSPHTSGLYCSSAPTGSSCRPAAPFNKCGVAFAGTPGAGDPVNVTFTFETRVPVAKGRQVKLILDGFEGSKVPSFTLAAAAAAPTFPGPDFFEVPGTEATMKLGCFKNPANGRNLKANSEECGNYNDADEIVSSVSMCQSLAKRKSKWGFCVQKNLCFMLSSSDYQTLSARTDVTSDECVGGTGSPAGDAMTCYNFSSPTTAVAPAGPAFSGAWDPLESALSLTAAYNLPAGTKATVVVTSAQAAITAPKFGLGKNSPLVRIGSDADMRAVQKSQGICVTPAIDPPPALNKTIDPTQPADLKLPGDSATKIGIPSGCFGASVKVTFRNEAIDLTKSPVSSKQTPASPVLRFSFPRGTVFLKPVKIELKSSPASFNAFLTWLRAFRLSLSARGLAYSPKGGIAPANSGRRALEDDAEMRGLADARFPYLRRSEEELELQEMKQHWFNGLTKEWVVIPETSVDEATGVVSGDIPASVFNNPGYDGLLCVMNVLSAVEQSNAAMQTFYGSATFAPTVTATIFLNNSSRTGVVVLPGTFSSTVTITLSSTAHDNTVTPLPESAGSTAGSAVLGFKATLPALKAIQFTVAIDTFRTARRADSAETQTAGRRATELTIFEPRLHWLNKLSNTWIALCDATYSAPYSTSTDQVASAVLNSDGFNPSSGCASALVGVDCSGAGGRLVVLNTPASICAEAAVAEASTKPENALDAVQIAAVVVATVLVFACVVGVQFAYRARTQSKGDGSRRSDSQLGFLEAESLLPQYPAAQLQGLQVLEEDPAEPPAPPARASDISAQVGFGGPYSALQSDAPEPPPRASLRAADFASYTPPPVASYQVDPDFWGEA